MPDSSSPALPLGRATRDPSCPPGHPFAQCHADADTPASSAQILAAPDPHTAPPEVVLELRVRNHPGTMSHVTGLFARRGFNLEAILCVPLDGGATSRMLLLVSEEPRLEQLERQLGRLYDVLAVRHRPDLSAEMFQALAAN